MHGHITSLAVARSHRKLGLATKLMRSARESAAMPRQGGVAYGAKPAQHEGQEAGAQEAARSAAAASSWALCRASFSPQPTLLSPNYFTHERTHIHTHTPPPPLPLIGREMLLRIAELVPKHPGRHRKGPPAKSDGGGGGGGAGTSAGGGGGGSSKKGGKKKK